MKLKEARRSTFRNISWKHATYLLSQLVHLVGNPPKHSVSTGIVMEKLQYSIWEILITLRVLLVSH